MKRSVREMRDQRDGLSFRWLRLGPTTGNRRDRRQRAAVNRHKGDKDGWRQRNQRRGERLGRAAARAK